MKSDRPGLLMIGAALLVICVVIGLWSDHHAAQQSTHVRSQGVGLVRLLSGMPYEQLVAQPGRGGLMQSILQLDRNVPLGYGIVVDKAGATVNEVTTAGTLIPAAAQMSAAGSWFGERRLTSPGDGRAIREFYGPVLDKGEVAGHVRLGFFETSPWVIGREQVSFAAMLALPVFLLVALFHFLMKREMQPLRELGDRLRQLSGESADGEAAVVNDLRGLLTRFTRFIELAHTRMHEIEAQRFTAQTASHMLTYRQEKVESVLHALPEALMVLDETGVVTFANAKLAGLLGVNAERLVGEPAREAIRMPELAAFLANCSGNPAPATRGVPFEFSPAASPGRRIAASAYPLFCPRSRENALGLLVAFRDVTAESLGREAGAEFVAHVSHELKSPLNVLKMYGEELLNEIDDTRERRIGAVNVINDQVERMAGLINNLLNISKIEQGGVVLDRQRVRVRDLLEEIAAGAALGARDKGIEVTLDLPQEMSPQLFDKDLLRIAITNLLSNAIKYNREGGSVALSAEEGDAQVAIRVRDTGIGIAPADLPRVFEKFYRAAGAGATAGGHGLGLYLARQITELHHGSLSVTSEPGQGTEFTMLLRKSSAVVEETVRL